MNFINDNSNQTGINSVLYTPIYSSVNKPNVIFNDSTTGIYNPSKDKIIIYTASTPALTIDSNQCIYENATGMTNINYSNVINK